MTYMVSLWRTRVAPSVLQRVPPNCRAPRTAGRHDLMVPQAVGRERISSPSLPSGASVQAETLSLWTAQAVCLVEALGALEVVCALQSEAGDLSGVGSGSGWGAQLPVSSFGPVRSTSFAKVDDAKVDLVSF